MARPNKILIVVTGDPPPAVAARHGDYADIMARAVGPAWSGGYASLDPRTEPLRCPAEPAGIIVTGSSASVAAAKPWMEATARWLAALIADGTPTLGVCFGHQLVAAALGGEVTPNPRGREMGTVTIERLGQSDLLAGLGDTFTANACHTDTVASLPPGTTVLARSPLDPHQCVQFRERCFGVQFHPEIDGWMMRAFTAARAPLIRADGLDPAVIRAGARDTPSGPTILGNFVARFVVGGSHPPHPA